MFRHYFSLPAFRFITRFKHPKQYFSDLSDALTNPTHNSSSNTPINPPTFIEDRLKLWDQWKSQNNTFSAQQERHPIVITLPDGRSVTGTAWETTPYSVVCSLSKSLRENALVAKVNNQLWDLDRPLEHSATLNILTFNDAEGRQVFWHSSSHILAQAMEQLYQGDLCHGPQLEEGFCYDMLMPHPKKYIQPQDYQELEDRVRTIIKLKQPFERLHLSKEQLLEMFRYSELKCRTLLESTSSTTTTVYRSGSLVELCSGPHLRHTGYVRGFKLTKNSSAFWQGHSDKERLQRLYGISFPENKLLQEWQSVQEEAERRDHRRIGLQQKLFFFHELSPGSCFFLPRGARIYNRLVEFIREEYCKRGYTEVVSPNLYNSRLWETSGHWDHYAPNMFQINIEKETYALKPMNCPGHCLMYAHEVRSYRELPIRLADFGVLHRNEPSGALTGLTRVRRFQQDDAHIFCREDQIKTEIKDCLQFLEHVYSVFGFSFKLYLSTRPEDYMGDRSLWDKAEKQLEESLNEAGLDWELNPGDGAFYGPKIDIAIMDALKRRHQCATIQLDFQLPERFDLTYMGEDNSATENISRLYRPVIIHRAILGSVERMIAILTESFAGKWPFWLSPMQAQVIPVVGLCEDYARQVTQRLQQAGFAVDLEADMSKSFNRKVRNAQMAQFNFILIIGEKEKENGTVNVRTRDNKVHGEHSVDTVLQRFHEFNRQRVLNAEELF